MKPKAVLFVHGIRDPGFWEQKLTQLFRERGVSSAKPIGYGIFDVFRFLIPLNSVRDRQVNWVRAQIENFINSHKDHEISIIAHSFGTYTVSRILDDNPNIKISRLIMCGGIVKRDFRWDKVAILNAQDNREPGEETDGPPKVQIINEHSARDFWPVAARKFTLGFGETGTIGCQATSVEDRRHAIKHGEYLTEDFASTYWVPIIAEDRPPTYPAIPEGRNPWYFVLLKVPVNFFVLVCLILAGAVVYHLYDRISFATRGDMLKASVEDFAITGGHDLQGEPSGAVYRAVDSKIPRKFYLYTNQRYRKLRVTISNRKPVACPNAGSGLGDESPQRNIANTAIFELDISDAYRLWSSPTISLTYDPLVRQNGQERDQLTVQVRQGMEPSAIRVLSVTHFPDNCIDDPINPEKFVRLADASPRVSAVRRLFRTVFSAFAAGPETMQPGAVLELLTSPDGTTRNLGVQTIIGSPDSFDDLVDRMLKAPDSQPPDGLADVIIAARDAEPEPIRVDMAHLIALTHHWNVRVREAARSYLRSQRVVDDDVAAAMRAYVDGTLAGLREKPVPERGYNQDYLLLIAARDVFYNLGIKRLGAYIDARKDGREADRAAVFGPFAAGLAFRDLAASDGQKATMAKNAYGLALAEFLVARVEQAAAAAGDAEAIGKAVLDGEARDLALAPDHAEGVRIAFKTFLEDVAGFEHIYPWPAHIEQANRCLASPSYACLTPPPAD